MYSTANLSDKELKDQGNRLFSLRKYEDAVNCYTKAIVSNNINKIIHILLLRLPLNSWPEKWSELRLGYIVGLVEYLEI